MGIPGVKSRKQLAAEYGVSPITFDKKIQPLRILLSQGEKIKRIYFPKEVAIIYDFLGVPVNQNTSESISTKR